MFKRFDECQRGDHGSCDGCCLDSVMGCTCPCHDGEDIPDGTLIDVDENDD